MRKDGDTGGTEARHTPGVWGWIAFVSTGVATPATLVANVWLLWSYVPEQVAVLADVGAPVPLTARITITVSSWFVRMLPFAIVASMFVGPLLLAGATVLMVVLEPWWRAARAFIAVGLVVSTVGCAAIIFVLTSIQAAHRVAGTGP